LNPPIIAARLKDTHRLIPSRYPPTGILDLIAAPEDFEAVAELEGWTNDRISAELGVLSILPAGGMGMGRTNATAIMAAYCHPHETGGSGLPAQIVVPGMLLSQLRPRSKNGISTGPRRSPKAASWKPRFRCVSTLRISKPNFMTFERAQSSTLVTTQQLRRGPTARRCASGGGIEWSVGYRSVRNPGTDCIVLLPARSR